MDTKYVFIILMFVIGWGSALVLQRLCKKKKVYFNWIRTTGFFFCVNYFLVSSVKMVLGEPESTLLESLWDIHASTFIHYAIPLFTVGIILPFAINKVFKESIGKYIDLFIVNIFIGGVVTSIICGGLLSNLIFCILFIVCAILAFIVVLLYKKDLVFWEYKEYMKGSKVLLPSVMLAAVMLLLYFPTELFIGNLDEFPCSLWEFLGVAFLGVLVNVVVGIIVCLVVLPKKVLQFVSVLLSGLLVVGYLQAMFFNGKLEILDGEEQVWGLSKQFFNSVVWVMLIGILLFVGYRKVAMQRIYRTVCIYICMVQVVSLGYMLFTTDIAQDQQGMALTNEGALELSSQNNVIVFVLDRFDSEILEKIMNTDQDFLEPLSDFTFYNNTTSQFSMTYTSIPYLLTGVAWNGESSEQYINYAYQKSNALPSMVQEGYQVGVYTAIRYYTPLFYEITANYKENVEKHCSIGTTISMMYQMSMYKIMPFGLKRNYAYYSTDINEIAVSEKLWNIENDLPFYHSLIQNGLTINENVDKIFKFYHMMGAHGPYYLSEDMEYDKTGRQVTELPQSKASLKIVYEYLRQMKELGVYDNALIIITADHGQRAEIGVDAEVSSRPILLVKTAGATQEVMTVSNKSVSQGNLMPTILQTMNIDGHVYGKTLDEMADNNIEERTYIDFGKTVAIQYSINGDAKQTSNWAIKSVKEW